jgi:hemerythrin-like metal-binding protein
MAFFDWKDEYSIGIALIDKQHHKVIELINELFESIRDSRGDMIIREVLDDLLDYSRYHFSLEEELFEKYGYEKLETHVREHEHFTKKVDSLMVGAEMNKECVPYETLDYLRDWFANHILKEDAVYSRFFQQRNLIAEIAKRYEA